VPHEKVTAIRDALVQAETRAREVEADDRYADAFKQERAATIREEARQAAAQTAAQARQEADSAVTTAYKRLRAAEQAHGTLDPTAQLIALQTVSAQAEGLPDLGAVENAIRQAAERQDLAALRAWSEAGIHILARRGRQEVDFRDHPGEWPLSRVRRTLEAALAAQEPEPLRQARAAHQAAEADARRLKLALDFLPMHHSLAVAIHSDPEMVAPPWGS
jgi:hypothetical protein